MHRSLDPNSLEDIIFWRQDMILEKINQIDTYLQMRAEASPTSHTLTIYTTIVYLIIVHYIASG